MNMYNYINCNLNQYTHTFQQMHAVFKTEMQHILLYKCDLPFEQCSAFLQDNIHTKYECFCKRYAIPFEGAQYAFPPFSTCLTFFSKEHYPF